MKPNIRYDIGRWRPRTNGTRLAGGVVAWMLLLGCDGDSVDPGAVPSSIVVTVDESINTVVHVSWKTSAETIGYIEYGSTSDLGLNTPMESSASLTHSASVLGLGASEEYFYRVVTWTGRGAGASAIGTFQLGPLPDAIPSFTQTGTGPDRLIVLPISEPDPSVVVLDSAARVVWYQLEDAGSRPYRARASSSGEGIIISALLPAVEAAPRGSIRAVAFDGTHMFEATVESFTGEFVELEDDMLALATTDVRTVGAIAVEGAAISERDSAGNLRSIWSTWDCFTPEVPADADASWHWTTIEGLQWDASSGAYFAQLSDLNSIVRIDPESGTCGWILGGSAATLVADSDTPLVTLRQFEARGDRIGVMGTDSSGQLHIIEYQVDAEALTATQVWRHDGPPSMAADAGFGQSSRISSTETLANWSSEGQLELIEEDNSVAWSLQASTGVEFGLHSLTNSLYVSP